MPTGTIMFFSSEGKQAHIWCNTGASPLYLAYETDFPELWSKLVVGMCVVIDCHDSGMVQRVTAMSLMAAET
ncbi:MAG: hypothetical protein AAFW87_00235 [Pseudomonadota bacterium]